MIWFFKKKEVRENKEEMKDAIKETESVVEEKVVEQQPLSVSDAKKYKVRYEWKKCIGSAVCEAVAPQHFKVENGKAILIGSKVVDDVEKVYEKEISESELDANKMAADGCPPNCIRVINIETGEEIAPKK